MRAFPSSPELYRERREHKVFMLLLKSVAGLEERIMTSDSEEEVHDIAALVSSIAHVGCRSIAKPCPLLCLRLAAERGIQRKV